MNGKKRSSKKYRKDIVIMEINNIELMEKVQKLAKDIENKKYQEDFKRVTPLVEKINEIKEEILKDKSYSQKAKEIIEKGIDFYFDLNNYDNQDINILIFDLEEFLDNDIDESIISYHSIDYIKEILNAFISLKVLMFEIYPAKEEIQRFFDILNFCLDKNLIDGDTIKSYLNQLNNNLYFYGLHKGNGLLNLCCGKITIDRRDFYSRNRNLFKYIIVSKENLDVIKDIEKQLEEKINKITV